MTAPFDDDPEMLAEAWHDHVLSELHELRECYVAIATCRETSPPVDEESAQDALAAWVERYGPEHVTLLLHMLGEVLWDGVRSAQREARTRLIRLRDANYVDRDHGFINRPEEAHR